MCLAETEARGVKAAGGSVEMFEDNVIESERDKGGGRRGPQSVSPGLRLLFCTQHTSSTLFSNLSDQ